MAFARLTKLPLLAALLLLATVSFAASQTVEKHTTPHHKAHKAPHRKGHKRPRGQQAIDGERARQIQEALIREHFLKGEPTGTWDSVTQDAMRRYQAEQGWQTKEVPDSRALIRLGLGPDKGHLLNPESAMTTEPVLPHRAANARAPQAPATRIAPALPTQSSTPVSTPSSASPGGPLPQ